MAKANYNLVLAEVELNVALTPNWIQSKLAVALRAKIEAFLLVDVLANQVLLRCLSRLDNLVDLHEVITIIFGIKSILDTHFGPGLDPYGIPQIIMRVDGAFATVTRKMNHDFWSPDEANNLLDRAMRFRPHRCWQG